MRPTLVLLAAVVLAALAANILGEYELTPIVSVVAGLVIGFGLAELVVNVGRLRGVVPALVVGALAAAALVWAGRIDSDWGVEPFPTGAWLGAAVGAVTAGLRTARAPAPT